MGRRHGQSLGRSPDRPLRSGAVSLTLAAQIDDFDPRDHLDPKRARRLDRFSALSVATARMAVAHAGLALDPDAGARTGVWIGSALGGVAFGEEQHAGYVARGVRGVAPTLALAVFGGAGASNVAIDLGLTGPSVGNSNSCASGAMAIGQAFHAIRDGTVDAALAGGAEAPLAPLTFGAFALIGVLSTRNDNPAAASRPFDVERDGFVMGEAAAILVLEERSAAIKRHAPVIAEIRGFGASNDAYHMTAPRPDGRDASRAITTALTDAELDADRIGYVNAHASGTPLNEPAEARAIHRALGPTATRTPVSGTKGLYGHALGASGAVEAAITALAISRCVLPGTCNLQTLDPAIELEVLTDAREARVDAALSNSFGFGGMNAALVFGRA